MYLDCVQPFKKWFVTHQICLEAVHPHFRFENPDNSENLYIRNMSILKRMKKKTVLSWQKNMVFVLILSSSR